MPKNMHGKTDVGLPLESRRRDLRSLRLATLMLTMTMLSHVRVLCEKSLVVRIALITQIHPATNFQNSRRPLLLLVVRNDDHGRG